MIQFSFLVFSATLCLNRKVRASGDQHTAEPPLIVGDHILVNYRGTGRWRPATYSGTDPKGRENFVSITYDDKLTLPSDRIKTFGVMMSDVRPHPYWRSQLDLLQKNIGCPIPIARLISGYAPPPSDWKLNREHFWANPSPGRTNQSRNTKPQLHNHIKILGGWMLQKKAMGARHRDLGPRPTPDELVYFANPNNCDFRNHRLLSREDAQRVLNWIEIHNLSDYAIIQHSRNEPFLCEQRFFSTACCDSNPHSELYLEAPWARFGGFYKAAANGHSCSKCLRSKVMSSDDW